MLSELEAMELLCRGHALEWTGLCWKVAIEPEQCVAIRDPEKSVADVAWLIGAPAIETHIVCAGSRMAALLRDTGVGRAWC
jgi:hypothetical protein